MDKYVVSIVDDSELIRRTLKKNLEEYDSRIFVNLVNPKALFQYSDDFESDISPQQRLIRSFSLVASKCRNSRLVIYDNNWGAVPREESDLVNEFNMINYLKEFGSPYGKNIVLTDVTDFYHSAERENIQIPSNLVILGKDESRKLPSILDSFNIKKSIEELILSHQKSKF